MNRSQSSRSSLVSLVSLVDLYLSALDSSFLTLFMKWRACGIMLPTWLRRPMRVARVECCTFVLFDIRDLMDFDQARAFSLGSDIVRALVLILHPRNVISSAICASALSLRIDAALGLSIGSSVPAWGRKRRCSAIRTADFALSICFVVCLDRRAAVARSSI